MRTSDRKLGGAWEQGYLVTTQPIHTQAARERGGGGGGGGGERCGRGGRC